MASARQPPSEPADPPPRLRLLSLDVSGYKALDTLHIEFPEPQTALDRDVVVLGSRNGIGKTSLLECCAIAIIEAGFPRRMFDDWRRPRHIHLAEQLVRAGEDHACIDAKFRLGTTQMTSSYQFSRQGEPTWKFPNNAYAMGLGEQQRDDQQDALGEDLFGRSSEPLVLPPVIFLHSYRKVKAGNLSLGAILDAGVPPRPQGASETSNRVSQFKRVLVLLQMVNSGLVEDPEAGARDGADLEKLDGLLREFAGSELDRLRTNRAGTLEIRVRPLAGGPSFSFDGLSSGQKEIITTLFLIWHHSRNAPCVVLIDEPELHQNPEWQRIFVHQLTKLAPANQYILATHSEEVFASVPQRQRIILNAR